MPEAPLTPAALIQRAGGVLSTEVGGELVLMSVTAGRYFSLDETGAEIWRCFESPCSMSNALTRLQATYDAEAGVMERDLVDLLVELRNYGLIQVLRSCEDN